MAGWAKEKNPGGSLKYQLVYLKFCVFKCSYHRYIYILQNLHQLPYHWGRTFYELCYFDHRRWIERSCDFNRNIYEPASNLVLCREAKIGNDITPLAV
jgi:hypothetical protein